MPLDPLGTHAVISRDELEHALVSWFGRRYEHWFRHPGSRIETNAMKAMNAMKTTETLRAERNDDDAQRAPRCPRDHAPPEAHRLFLGADASADRRVPQSTADAYWRPLSDPSARSNSSRVACRHSSP
jgi:hypothetical protein